MSRALCIKPGDQLKLSAYHGSTRRNATTQARTAARGEVITVVFGQIRNRWEDQKRGYSWGNQPPSRHAHGEQPQQFLHQGQGGKLITAKCNGPRLKKPCAWSDHLKLIN